MITFLDNNFSQLNTFLKELNPTQILILVDENTHEHCLPELLGNLETNVPFEIIEIEPGEEMKTLETAAQLWEILTEFKTDRKGLLINLGGGVITDMGGFIASTYKRGIKFINVPTTLLGMCDASLGGKTGIDHQFIKNIIGTFALPEQVFVYTDFLKTLPFEELRSGFAEMLKHGLIADKTHWQDLQNIPELSAELISPFIVNSMKIKENIISEDFREENIRKTLNFGHTIGHAVESLFLQKNSPVLHGEAVALGMICETQISLLQNRLSEHEAEEIFRGIRKFFPDLNINEFLMKDLLNLMKNDKKNNAGAISFTLINSIGYSAFDCSVDPELIFSALYFYQNLD